MVDHSDFIPKRFLPTFKSHFIEVYLHDIPGLAEPFIYLCVSGRAMQTDGLFQRKRPAGLHGLPQAPPFGV